MLRAIGERERVFDSAVRSNRGGLAVCTEPSVGPAHSDVLLIGLQLSGWSVLAQDGREVTLGPGDLVLYDGGRPFSLVTDGRSSRQLFVLPKNRVRRSDGEIADLTARPVQSTTDAAAIVIRFLRDLAVRADRLEDEGVYGQLCEHATDLVVTLLRSHLGRDLAVKDPQRLLVRQAVDYIDAHLQDRDLGPERIAAAVGVSVRRLHQLFSSTERTVSEHVRIERLGAVRRDLADPRFAHHPISWLAASHGIANASLFSRQFRLAEGCTPTEFRDRALRAGTTRGQQVPKNEFSLTLKPPCESLHTGT